MPCSKVDPSATAASTGQRYSKLEDCLEACKEGACCEGTTCTVKPQCQCQGTGKTFSGVGTTCDPSPCVGACCESRAVGIDPNAGPPAYAAPRCTTTTQSGCSYLYQPSGASQCGEIVTPGGASTGALCLCDFGICCQFNNQPSGGKYFVSYSGSTATYKNVCQSQGGTWVYCADGTGRVGDYKCSLSDPFEFNPLP